jgi:hypothetical protein
MRLKQKAGGRRILASRPGGFLPAAAARADRDTVETLTIA